MPLMASFTSYGTFEVKHDDIIEEMLIPEQEMLIKLIVLDNLYIMLHNETIDCLKQEYCVSKLV